MDNNQKVFFILLRSGLWETEASLSDYNNIDFSIIYRLAVEQAVDGIVAAGIEHIVDGMTSPDDTLDFVDSVIQLEQQNAAMDTFIGKLIDRMRAVGIYAVLIKGQGVAQNYERPHWRVCGDVDLLISETNYEKAKKFLFPLASEVQKENNEKKHLGMTIGMWEVELHGNLHSGLSREIDRTLDDLQYSVFYEGRVCSWLNNNTRIYILKADEDVVYVFSHILEHFYKGGVGLRQICDWCRLLWTNKDTLDLSLLQKRLKQMCLLSEWKAFGAFAVEYLGLPANVMPFYDSSEKWDKKAKKICDFILHVGNFGQNRNLNYLNSTSFFVRKLMSFYIRCKDFIHHMTIFPLDSLRFFPYMVYNGLKSAI